MQAPAKSLEDDNARACNPPDFHCIIKFPPASTPSGGFFTGYPCSALLILPHGHHFSKIIITELSNARTPSMPLRSARSVLKKYCPYFLLDPYTVSVEISAQNPVKIAASSDALSPFIGVPCSCGLRAFKPFRRPCRPAPPFSAEVIFDKTKNFLPYARSANLRENREPLTKKHRDRLELQVVSVIIKNQRLTGRCAHPVK